MQTASVEGVEERSPGRPRRQRWPGFTMAELVVGTAIAILLLAALSSLYSRERDTNSAGARPHASTGIVPASASEPAGAVAGTRLVMDDHGVADENVATRCVSDRGSDDGFLASTYTLVTGRSECASPADALAVRSVQVADGVDALGLEEHTRAASASSARGGDGMHPSLLRHTLTELERETAALTSELLAQQIDSSDDLARDNPRVQLRDPR